MLKRLRETWQAPLVADGAILFALAGLNALIVARFLATGFSAEPWNNDYLYIGITRLFRDHAWSWSAIDYGGAPFRYIQPPLLHLLSLAIPGVSLGRAFHIVTGLSYAWAPAALYLALRALVGSRAVSATVALMYSVMPSPVYYLLESWHGLAARFHDAPWGFVAIDGYAEAAHAISFLLMLAALAAAFRNRWVWGSVFCAFALLANWAGALALAMMLVSLWIGRSRDLGWREATLRVAAMGAAGYGLAAWWITPAFIKATLPIHSVFLKNDYIVVPRLSVTLIVGAVALALIVLSVWRAWTPAFAFALTFTALTGAVVFNFTLGGLYLFPLAHRSVLELSLAFFLLLACALEAVPRWRGAALVAVLALAAFASRGFLGAAWQVEPRSIDPQTVAVAPVAKWLHDNAAASRVMVAGELGSSMKLWTDTPQVSGPGQGIWNFLFPAVHRQVTLGCEPDSHLVELWLRALNIEYLVLQNGPSREYFHLFAAPERFGGFPVAWTNGAGDTIYRTLPAGTPEAVVVDRDRVASLGTLRSTGDRAFLERYVAWAAGKRPANIEWSGADRAWVTGPLGPREAVLVKINHHTGWRSPAARIESDPLGLLLLSPSPGATRIPLAFDSGPEFRSACALTLLGLAILVSSRSQVKWTLIAVFAAVAGALTIAAPRPPFVGVAVDAFERVHPPVISAGGIVDGRTNTLPLERDQVATLYGFDLGKKAGDVRVRIGPRPAEILHWSPNQINARVPKDAGGASEISVEVNGCRGNSFVVPVR